jgi:YgiT-type zinc finger domain-containing protein
VKIGDAMSESFEKCPVCGGELVEKEVEKLLKGGCNTASVRVRAEVCQHCGERLYSEQTIRWFEDIRRKLEKQDTGDFRLCGKAFEITT